MSSVDEELLVRWRNPEDQQPAAEAVEVVAGRAVSGGHDRTRSEFVVSVPWLSDCPQPSHRERLTIAQAIQQRLLEWFQGAHQHEHHVPASWASSTP
jgi:hypothetical protein